MAKNRRGARLAPENNRANTIRPNNIIINQIEVRPVNRQILDIGKWQQAVKSADVGRKTLLFNLYEDIIIDGVLGDAIDKRIRAVTGADLTFQYADGSESEDMIKFIDTDEFEYLLDEIMNALFWGVSLIQPLFDTNGMSVYSVPRKHIRPETKTIARHENDPEGNISYEGLDVLEIVPRKHKHGLILRACPYTILKRGGIGDWAQMVEIFGMPMRIGKYNLHDPEARQALQQAFDAQGAAASMIIPIGTEIDAKPNTSTGGGTLYKDFIATMDEQILISMLSQTMTTKDGASRSQGQVHKDVEEELNRHDLRFVQRILNHRFLPILERRGYPVKGGSFVFPKALEDLTVEQIIKLSDVLVIPAYYLQEKFGIPAAKGKDVVLQRWQAPQPPSGGLSPEPTEKKEKKGLFDFFAFAPTQERGFLEHHTALSDSDNLNDRIISRIDGKSRFDIELYEYTRDRLFEAVQSHLQLSDTSASGSLSEVEVLSAGTAFVYGQMDDAYKTAMEINLFHFSAAKTIAEITELNRLFRNATSFEGFYREASSVTDIFNRKWLETEYQTALLVAESASNYWRLKKQADIFPYWQYRAIMDGRTREAHANLNGTILPANDARWDKIMPPNGWNCRCRIKALMKHELPVTDFNSAQAAVDEYLQSDEWRSVAAQGWDTNRAKTAEVFTKNQQYINKFPQKGGKFLDDLTAQKWGRETVPKLIDRATENIPKTELSAAEIWDRYAEKETIKLRLFNDREVTLSKKNFDAHTTGKKDDRSVFFDAMMQTLENPDELWLNNEQRIDRGVFRKWIVGGKEDNALAKQLNYDNFNAIKYYKDGVIVANYRITDGALELRTWYSMAMKKDVWEQKRRGLLIKQKRE